MKMKVYAVFKTGVYRHECAGIFSTPDAADAAAERCISGERDDYHDYKVVAFELDAVTPQTTLVKLPGGMLGGGGLEEAEALCTWSRINGVVSKQLNVAHNRAAEGWSG
jgi:hypothetical protein